MNVVFSRLMQASSLGGIGMIISALPGLISSKGADQQSLALFLGGLAAVLKNEQSSAAPQVK